MKKLLLVPVILILIVIGLCGFVGFQAYSAYTTGDFTKLSFLSKLLSGKAPDLGVTYTRQDAVTFLEKNKFVATNSCPSGKTCNASGPSYFGSVQVATTLTNTEGTALINEWITLSGNAPFSSAQMRVNADGTVDFSGTVDMTRLKNFAAASQVPAETRDMALKYIGALGETFPVTANGKLEIKNGAVNANFSSVKIGFISVPTTIFTEEKGTIDSFISARLAVVPGLSISELSFADGKTTFKGVVPQTIVFKK